MFGGIWRGSSHEKRRRGRTANLDRDGPRGGTGERSGDHPPRRHGGAQHRGDVQGAAGGDRLLSPHVRLRGEAVRGGQDPGRVHAPGGPAKRDGDPRVASDRPAAAAAVPGGFPARRAGHLDRAVCRPGERPDHPEHQRRIDRACHLRYPVPGSRRRGPHGVHRRPGGREPAHVADRGLGARPRCRRHGGRDPDGRGRGQGRERAGCARRVRFSPRGDQANLRRPARAATADRAREAGVDLRHLPRAHARDRGRIPRPAARPGPLQRRQADP